MTTDFSIKSKPKMTIAFEKTFDPMTITIDELMKQHATLHDRAVCETNLNLIQPILYMVLVNDEGPEPVYFVYTRGKASGEKGLVGQCSIGIGGHTEELTGSVAQSLAEAAVRELDEEVGIKFVTTESIYQCLIGTETNDSFVTNPFVLYNPVTDVDKVHIGVVITIDCTYQEFGELEEGVITRGEWLTFKQISNKENDPVNPIQLETWTKSVIANLMTTTA